MFSRIFVIVHLCIAFTIAGSVAIGPSIQTSTAAKHHRQLVDSLPAEARTQVAHVTPPSYSFHLSAWTAAWLIASVMVCVGLLKEREWAKRGVWAIPLLVVGWIVEPVPTNSTIYPSEQYIVANYVKSALTGTPSHQRAQLQTGWHDYLASEWGEATSASRGDRVERGRVAFEVARLSQGQTRLPMAQGSRPALLLLLGWSLLMVGVSRRRETARTEAR